MHESPDLGFDAPRLDRDSSRFARDSLKFDGESVGVANDHQRPNVQASGATRRLVGAKNALAGRRNAHLKSGNGHVSSVTTGILLWFAMLLANGVARARSPRADWESADVSSRFRDAERP